MVDCATDTTYYPVAVTDYWAVDNLPFVESSELASNLGLLNMDTSGGDEYLRIVQSACATNEQVVLSHALQYASSAARFLFSINNLRATTKLWKLDGVSFAALATSTNVRSIVLTALGMSIVTDVNVFFWSRLDGLLVATGLPASFIAALTSNSAAETGVTASTIIGHRASAYCDATTLLQSTPDLAPENNRAVILWRRAAGHAMYYSSDGGLTFTAIDLAVKLATLIPIMDANSQWVTDAVIVPTQQGISFNLRYKVSTIVKDRLVIVHRVFGEQSGMRFVLGRLASTAPTSLLKVETLPAGSSELFAYGETLSYR